MNLKMMLTEKSSKYYCHAKFDTYHIYDIKDHTIKLFITNACTAGWLDSLILMMTQTHKKKL